MHEQTLAIHAGYDKDSMGTMAVPIYQTTISVKIVSSRTMAA